MRTIRRVRAFTGKWENAVEAQREDGRASWRR